MIASPLVPGQVYRVVYRYQAANYRMVEREIVAKYLGHAGPDLAFSLRPVMGTQHISSAGVVSAVRVADDSRIVTPRVPRSVADVTHAIAPAAVVSVVPVDVDPATRPHCADCGEPMTGERAEMYRPDAPERGAVVVHQEPCAVAMRENGWEIA